MGEVTPPGSAPKPRATPAVKRRFSYQRFAAVYRQHMPGDPRRERLFLASVAFLVTFALIRALTYSIRYNVGPFHNVTVGGAHVHHLVWGILLLLVVGYVALVEFGTSGPVSSFVTRLGAAAFGVGAALTLDEFALWLNLQDVYWERQGRLSVDAVLIFGALLLVGVFGRDLLRALAWEFRMMVAGAAYVERVVEDEIDHLRDDDRSDDDRGDGDGGRSGDGGEGPQKPVDRAP
jgi:hypothetical protein